MCHFCFGNLPFTARVSYSLLEGDVRYGDRLDGVTYFDMRQHTSYYQATNANS